MIWSSEEHFMLITLNMHQGRHLHTVGVHVGLKLFKAKLLRTRFLPLPSSYTQVQDPTKYSNLYGSTFVPVPTSAVQQCGSTCRMNVSA